MFSDCIQLKNGILAVLSKNTVELFNIENNPKKEKEIILDGKRTYYKIINYKDDILLLSILKDGDEKENKNKSFFTYLSGPNYEPEDFQLLNVKNEGDLIQMGNLTVIGFCSNDFFIM